jgi:hypothetical protein
MKKLIVPMAVCVLFLCAGSASADAQGPCQACVERWLWPWMEDCWFCESVNCGQILCEIHDCSPGLECCVLQGEGCGEGNPQCEDPPPHGLLQPAPKPNDAQLADCDRAPFLSETWRLKRVQLLTRARARSRRV